MSLVANYYFAFVRVRTILALKAKLNYHKPSKNWLQKKKKKQQCKWFYAITKEKHQINILDGKTQGTKSYQHGKKAKDPLLVI